MKIKIEFTLEIDPKSWAYEYGMPCDTKQDLTDIRNDVKGYVEEMTSVWFQDRDHSIKVVKKKI